VSECGIDVLLNRIVRSCTIKYGPISGEPIDPQGCEVYRSGLSLIAYCGVHLEGEEEEERVRRERE
jgi:hypothetical protein